MVVSDKNWCVKLTYVSGGTGIGTGAGTNGGADPSAVGNSNAAAGDAAAGDTAASANAAGRHHCT